MVAELRCDHGSTVGRVAQQMVGAQSAGVERTLGATSLAGARETGKPPTSSGGSDLSGQAEDMHWSLWSLIFGSCLGAFEQVAIGLLRKVEAKERESDPALVDEMIVLGRQRRLSIQLYNVLALFGRRKVSPVVRRVVRSFRRGAVQRI